MTTSSQLQDQADEARSGLSTALEDLRKSVTTTALTNGAMTFAKDGSAAVAKAAVDRAMANPFASLLIGAGLVMLMSKDKPSSSGGPVGKDSKMSGSVADTAASVGASIADTAAAAKERVSAGASGMTDVAAETYGKAKDIVAKGQEKTMRKVHDAEDLLADTKSRMMKLAEEQPVLVAALGVALGAALGASLPITEAERDLVGETGRKITDTGTQLAGKVADAVTTTVTAGDVKGKVGEVAEAVTSTISNPG